MFRLSATVLSLLLVGVAAAQVAALPAPKPLEAPPADATAKPQFAPFWSASALQAGSASTPSLLPR